MLRDKNGMTPERCLSAIVDRLRRGEPPGNEISRVGEHRFHSLFPEIFAFFGTERESASECRALESREDIVELSHFNYWADTTSTVNTSTELPGISP